MTYSHQQKTPSVTTTKEMAIIEQILDKAKTIEKYSKSACSSTTTNNDLFYDTLPINHSGQSPLRGLQQFSLGSKRILSPVVLPYYDTNNNNQFAGLYITTFARTIDSITKYNLKFKYSFTLNTTGEPQLNIYISFDYKGKIASNYYYDGFYVNLGVNQFNGVKIEGILTAKVFLIDTDPQTTRGTVTTVKPTSTD